MLFNERKVLMMKRFKAVLFGCLISCLAAIPSEAAQNFDGSSQDQSIALFNFEPGAKYDYCIDQFYDPDTYNWLSFRNTCDAALNVTFRWGDGTNGGAIHLQPGKHSSAGYTRSEVSSKGGTVLAICRLGWIPVDANNNNWKGGLYQCRQLY